MRWSGVRLAVGGWAAAATVAAAADPSCPTCDRLPPLLPVPNSTPAPAPPPSADTGPAVEYDRSRLYLPDALPVSTTREPPPGPSAPPPDRGWLAPAILLGWSSNAPAPAGLPGIDRLDLPFRAGLKVDAGLWRDADQTWAIEFGGLYFAPTSGARTVAVPAGDGLGVVNADWTARFASADLGVRHEVYRGKWPVVGEVRATGSAGYRFAYLGESLGERLAVGPNQTESQIDVTNYFHGAEAGLVAGWWWGYWSVDFAGRVGLGAVVTNVEQSATGVQQVSGSRTQFGVMPTVAATVGRRVGEHTRLFAGYTLQYLSGVGRPGGPPSQPTEFRVQGVNLGVELGY
jgi:hypothetical protein